MSRSKRATVAFSLLEALIALTILGVVMLATGLALQHALAFERRVKAHHAVLRALEAEHEALRAGIAFSLGDHELVPTLAPTSDTGISDFRLRLQAEQSSAFLGLYELELEARYELNQQSFTRKLELRVFRP
jgi:type II secretory pathway pseudopilin PulG